MPCVYERRNRMVITKSPFLSHIRAALNRAFPCHADCPKPGTAQKKKDGLGPPIRGISPKLPRAADRHVRSQRTLWSTALGTSGRTLWSGGAWRPLRVSPGGAAGPSWPQPRPPRCPLGLASPIGLANPLCLASAPERGRSFARPRAPRGPGARRCGRRAPALVVRRAVGPPGSA